MVKMEEAPLLVNDIMTKKVITVHADESVSEVIKSMISNDISGLIVLDYIGDVVGMISAIDIFKVFNESDERNQDFLAEDIMTPYMIDIQAEMSAEDAAKIMLEKGIHRLVVTVSPSKKKPVGIITSTDIVRAFG
ncbi:MAG: CBS domain-containing protein [Candidatus Hydrothermarchaeaceae archaeon]